MDRFIIWCVMSNSTWVSANKFLIQRRQSPVENNFSLSNSFWPAPEIGCWNSHCVYWEFECLCALLWRHNGRDSVSNHQPHDCSLNRLFRRRSKKTSKLRVTGLCEGNSPGTGEFPAQRASNAENASIWWRHHGRWNLVARYSNWQRYNRTVPTDHINLTLPGGGLRILACGHNWSRGSGQKAGAHLSIYTHTDCLWATQAYWSLGDLIVVLVLFHWLVSTDFLCPQRNFMVPW